MMIKSVGGCQFQINTFPYLIWYYSRDNLWEKMFWLGKIADMKVEKQERMNDLVWGCCSTSGICIEWCSKLTTG